MLVHVAAFNARKADRRFFAEMAWVERRIGMFTMRLSQLERIIDQIIEKKCGRSKVVGCTLSDHVNTLAKAMQNDGDNARNLRIDEWHSVMKEIVETRNQIMHGFWGKSVMGNGEFGLFPQLSDRKRDGSNLAHTLPMIDRKRLSQAVRSIDEMSLSLLRNSDLFR